MSWPTEAKRRIAPPFANYHRAELERLVQEGFDFIERHAAQCAGGGIDSDRAPMSLFDFQVLMAADSYLRSTQTQS